VPATRGRFHEAVGTADTFKWVIVPQWNTPGDQNTFAVALDSSNGKITITHGRVDATHGIVGLSNGDGMSTLSEQNFNGTASSNQDCIAV
jgi:hypothetical protein